MSPIEEEQDVIDPGRPNIIVDRGLRILGPSCFAESCAVEKVMFEPFLDLTCINHRCFVKWSLRLLPISCSVQLLSGSAGGER
jgi:hypothetical protein